MANAKSARRGKWLLVGFVLLAGALAAFWFSAPGTRLRGDAIAGTAYGARVACSCRFVAGRSMDDCARDKLAGMGMIRFTADEAAKSVTASVPFIASDTATLRDGYGCVLDTWRGRSRG